MLGGGFKDFLFSSLPGEMIQFDEHIFQMGRKHQLDMLFLSYTLQIGDRFMNYLTLNDIPALPFQYA